MAFISCLFLLALLSTSLFDMLSVHDVCNILRYIQISKTSGILAMADVTAQISDFHDLFCWLP